jgi:hypothetical protein
MLTKLNVHEFTLHSAGTTLCTHNNVKKHSWIEIAQCTYNNIHGTYEPIVGIAQCTHNNVNEIHESTLHNACKTIACENKFWEEGLRVQEWFNENEFWEEGLKVQRKFNKSGFEGGS